tara:strand:- start:69 stop:2222 length:2154 start_codon:yes stop_codon:yes gene_type:complete
MVRKHDAHYTDVDKWAEVADDDYCYTCSKWIEATDEDCCPTCNTSLDYGDKWESSETAKVATSEAPRINTMTGDIWNRTRGYVWGGGSGWWQGSTQATGNVSSMWGSWGGVGTNNNSDAARMLKHKRHLDSLCKVVDPTISHILDYAGNETSYSDMKRGKIYIDGTMLKKSDDNLDITAGLAIHEKLHLIHSKPLLKWESDYRHENKLDGRQGQLLHNIANMVEDEYIEKQLATDNAGFVTYIEAVKNHYFDTKIEGRLNNDDENAFNDILNTLLAFIRWPNNLDSDRKKKHAKHIQFFARALKDSLDSRENTLKSIGVIYQYLSKVADAMVKEDPSLQEKIDSKFKEMKDGLSNPDDMSSDDWDRVLDSITQSVTGREARKSSIARMFSQEDAKEFEGITDYAKGALEHEDADMESMRKDMKELEDSDYHEETLKDVGLIHNGCKKITWRRAMPTTNDKERYTRESKQMKATTQALKRKIDLYGNSQKHIVRNQKRGKIDKRMLHRIPVGRSDLFKIDIHQDDKPLDVCLLVDESGSMSYDKMDIARQSAIALKEALQDNPKLNLWVYGHTADGAKGWHTDMGSTNITEYWSPTMKDRPMAMGAMTHRYENRDGTAIHAVANRVKKESEQPMSNKLMIVISDGQPAAHMYGGMDGASHVSKVVKHLESQGWSIIQVGIYGSSERLQEIMFTNHMYVDNLSDLAPKIGKIIRRVIKV